MPDQHADPPAGPEQISDAVRDRIRDDLAALSELTAAGIEVDGRVQVAESTWVVYGHTSYDGEIVLGEYHDVAEASAVLRAAPRPDPGPSADHDLEPGPGPDHERPLS